MTDTNVQDDNKNVATPVAAVVTKIEAKIYWGPLANDIRTYFTLCKPQELEIYRSVLLS